MDYTGTGNSLNVRSPQSLQLIMDSLRYWVTEMHVDGFRFDLASTLAREFYDVDRLSTFFEVVQQDPVVGQVKLIAEPWDVGPGGYQVGNFPPNWTEWNGKYRDTVRDFWRGEPATLAEFASRITGSADLYQDDGRQPVPLASTSSPRTTGSRCNDLVSYNDKHNEANGEENRDGESHNRSWNCGVEGPTDDPEVLALRAKQRRNFLATLMLSPGRADDLARRRAGPHPAGQQQRVLPGQRDRPGSTGSNADEQLLDFTRRLTAFRHRHQVFQRRPVLHRPAGDRARRRRPAARPGVVHPGRPADGRRRLGQRLRPGGRAVRQRRGHPRARPVRPAARGRLVPAASSTPTTRPSSSPRRRREYGEKWEKVIETAEPSPDDAVGRRGGRHDLGAGPVAHRAGQDGLRWPPRSAPTGSRSAPTSTCDATAGLADYLADLGVSHLYTAPLLTATPGSRARLRRGRPPRGQPASSAARRPGSAASGALARGRPRPGRRHRAQPRRGGRPGRQPDLVGRAAARARSRRTPAVYDIDWSPRPAAAAGAGRRPGRARRPDASTDGELRYYEQPLPDRRRHRRRHARGRCTTGSTTSWSNWTPRRRRAQLPPVLRHHRPGRAAGRGPGGLRRHPRRDPALGTPTGEVDGIRVDHPDGLRDPGGYLARLRDAAPDAWLVVEKILEPGEELPHWPVDGTTGYDALAEVCGVFVDPATEAFFDTLDHHLTGGETSWQDLVHETKLGRGHHGCSPPSWRRLARARTGDRRPRPRALAELAACFPVYRSYLPFGARHLAQARSEAGRRRPQLIPVLDRSPRRLRNPDDELARAVPAVHRRGDGQGRRGHRVLPLDPVHRAQRGRRRPGRVRRHAGRVPRRRRRAGSGAGRPAMTTLSTHDTKRSEDVRARLAVLAEVPGDWTEVVRRWVRRRPAARPGAGPPDLAGRGRAPGRSPGSGCRRTR